MAFKNHLTFSRWILAVTCLCSFIPASRAQTSDASGVTLGSVSQSYCTSIDGVDYNSTQYFKSAADVLAKTGLTIQSQNTGNACCTAAKPWNGAACVAPLICPSGQEAVSGVCKATTTSCAAIGQILVSGSCVAAASGPACTYNGPTTSANDQKAYMVSPVYYNGSGAYYFTAIGGVKGAYMSINLYRNGTFVTLAGPVSGYTSSTYLIDGKTYSFGSLRYTSTPISAHRYYEVCVQ